MEWKEFLDLIIFPNRKVFEFQGRWYKLYMYVLTGDRYRHVVLGDDKNYHIAEGGRIHKKIQKPEWIFITIETSFENKNPLLLHDNQVIIDEESNVFFYGSGKTKIEYLSYLTKQAVRSKNLDLWKTAIQNSY